MAESAKQLEMKVEHRRFLLQHKKSFHFLSERRKTLQTKRKLVSIDIAKATVFLVRVPLTLALEICQDAKPKPFHLFSLTEAKSAPQWKEHLQQINWYVA